MPNPLTKSALIRIVADKNQLSRQKSRQVVNGLISAIIQSIRKGRAVKIPRLGIWSLKSRPARFAVNPKTQEQIRVRKKLLVRYTVSPALKGIVNE